MHDILELSNKLLPELREIAKGLKIKRTESLKKQDLIYKILDQQAIEATEKKKVNIQENKPSGQSSDQVGQQRDKQGQRRGRRPRMVKPVVNRQVESVITVSPDDLKKAEEPVAVRSESEPKPEKPEVKPDLFKTAEGPKEAPRSQKWQPRNQNFRDRKDRGPSFNEKFSKTCRLTSTTSPPCWRNWPASPWSPPPRGRPPSPGAGAWVPII